MATAPSLIETTALYRDGRGASGVGEFFQPTFPRRPIDPALAAED
jgi:hypothetical protein